MKLRNYSFMVILGILITIKISEAFKPRESYLDSSYEYEDLPHKPELYQDHSESHHEPYKPHHKPQNEPKGPYHQPPKSHYESKDPEPRTPHLEPHKPQHEPHITHPEHHKPHHYQPKESHYEPKDPKPHTPYHESHEPHYEPSYEEANTYHDKKHNPDCLDVSTYGKITYKKVEKQHCTIEYKKHIANKTEKVCNTVTSLKPCSVLPYTECHMTLKDETHYSCDWFWKFGTVIACVNVTKTVEHIKKKPKCTKKPKYHCRERWEINEYGKKIWAGTKDCKLIEWEDCTLENVKVKFHYIQPDCSGKKPVPLHDIRNQTDSSVTSSLQCYVKKTPTCVQDIGQKCRNIYYTETVIKPVTKCKTLEIWIPNQERHHKQKCLFENGDEQTLPTDPLKGIYPGESPNVPIKPESVYH